MRMVNAEKGARNMQQAIFSARIIKHDYEHYEHR